MVRGQGTVWEAALDVVHGKGRWLLHAHLQVWRVEDIVHLLWADRFSRAVCRLSHGAVQFHVVPQGHGQVACAKARGEGTRAHTDNGGGAALTGMAHGRDGERCAADGGFGQRRVGRRRKTSVWLRALLTTTTIVAIRLRLNSSLRIAARTVTGTAGRSV